MDLLFKSCMVCVDSSLQSAKSRQAHPLLSDGIAMPTCSGSIALMIILVAADTSVHHFLFLLDP